MLLPISQAAWARHEVRRGYILSCVLGGVTGTADVVKKFQLLRVSVDLS